MIRMGRGKVESTENPQAQDNYSNNYSSNSSYSSTQENVSPMSRGGAISESESMARDIKEGRLSGFVGHGTVLTGETNFQAMLRVDGHLTGSVSSENGTLIIGTSGRVDANISVAAAVINGTVNGDIIALEKIELGRSARVAGNLQTPRLLIEDGAMFEGGCSMIKAKEMLEQRSSESYGRHDEVEPVRYENEENNSDSAEDEEAGSATA